MKKVILIIVISLMGITTFAQSKVVAKRLKYITEAPDGSVAMIIYDDNREDTMKLESASNFYKYEILEPSTNEPIYISQNRGKSCSIDKSKIVAGTYNIRLYTSSFVITSKITIMATRKFKTSLKTTKDIIASRE